MNNHLSLKERFVASGLRIQQFRCLTSTDKNAPTVTLASAPLAGEATRLRCESLRGRAAHGLDGPLAHSVTRRCCVCVP